MTEFTLSKIQGTRDAFTGRLNFAQTKEFKTGMAIYFIFYMLATLADDFGHEWFVIPGFIIALIAFILSYIPFSSTKNAGKVILAEKQIKFHPKKDGSNFPDSPINLEQISELEINIVQSIRLWSSYIILQFVIKEDGSESAFGLTIKNRKQEEQYLDILESWYKAGLPVREFDISGSRVFKLDQGKNYADIQKIKTEYGIDW
jgi:hypothetical protein